jgi:hypothetical protein
MKSIHITTLLILGFYGTRQITRADPSPLPIPTSTFPEAPILP